MNPIKKWLRKREIRKEIKRIDRFLLFSGLDVDSNIINYVPRLLEAEKKKNELQRKLNELD